jgi:hypothetical protein
MYAVAAYTAPIAIVSPALGVLPVISCLSSLLGIYTIYLNIVAIKAVHRLSWGRAFLASTLMISLVIVALACFFVAMLAVFGAFAASGSN